MLILSKIPKEERLAWVTWHELGHLGVNVKYRSEYQGLMEKARKHSVVGAMAQAIMIDRQRFVDKDGNYNDPAATNKNIATEEALVELLAAHETGNFAELRQRYGVKINALHEKNFKAWFKIIADKVRQLMNKLFGRSFDEMTDYDLIRLIGGIKQGINSNPTPPTTGKRFSLNESPDSDFVRAVDKIANGGVGRKDRWLRMGRTPPVLKILGLNDTKVAMRENVIDKILHEHAVSAEDLKRIPQQINDPIAVMKSNPSSTNPNGLIVLTELNELDWKGNEKPVVAALQLKKEGENLEVINITSVYGRDLIKQIPTDLNRTVYWNKTKGYQFARTVGLQLPSSLTSVDNLSRFNIKTEEDLKQYLSEQKSDNVRYSHASAKQSLLDLAKTGKTKTENNFWQSLKSLNYPEIKAHLVQFTAKADEYFADALRPVNDWIDNMEFSYHTGKTSSRDFEKQQLKNAMYTAKGVRDALNSELEHA